MVNDTSIMTGCREDSRLCHSLELGSLELALFGAGGRRQGFTYAG